MSILIDDPTGVAAGGTMLLVLAGGLMWRLGIEFDRGWRRSEAAPPEPWERELFERMRREAAAAGERRDPGAPVQVAQGRALALA
jgi:hypothetical protein